MKKLIKTIIITLFITILSSCIKSEKNNKIITLINKSDNAVLFQPLVLEIYNTDDTLFQCAGNFFGFGISSIFEFRCGRHCNWKTELNNSKYLQLIYVDKDVYEQYLGEPCDTIRKYVPILHRYQLTLEDLRRMNWTVVYPPEEESDE